MQGESAKNRLILDTLNIRLFCKYSILKADEGNGFFCTFTFYSSESKLPLCNTLQSIKCPRIRTSLITLFTGKRKISGFKWLKREKWESSFQRKRFLYNGKGLVEWVIWEKRIKISRPLGNLEWVERYRGDSLGSMDVKWFEIHSETRSRGHLCYTGICVLSDRKTVWLGLHHSPFLLRGKFWSYLYLANYFFKLIFPNKDFR